MFKKKYRAIFLGFVSLFLVILGFYCYYITNRETMCFSGHLLDAIDINQNRAPYYSDHSSTFSKTVSKELIKNERVLLPAAFLVDLRAHNFIKNHINIVCGDFVDMNNINEKEQAPRYRGTASNVVFGNLENIFFQEKKAIIIEMKNKNYKNIADRVASLLKFIKQTETEEQANFCMSKHVLESIGYAAIHASNNSLISHGKTDGLSSYFINIKIQGLSSETLIIDKNAQIVHKLGLGIVCNDVPHIPFLEEWEKASK